MLARIERFSEIDENFCDIDKEPLRVDVLRSLINMAELRGYRVADASDLKLPQDDISTDLYAVWYAMENELCIFADNITHLINMTECPRQRCA